MKNTITILIFSFTFLSWGKSPGTYSQLRSDLSKISSKNFINIVNNFVKESAPSRMVGLPGHSRARDFIMSSIKNFDLKQTGKVTLTSSLPDITKIKSFYETDFQEKVEGKIPRESSEYKKWRYFTDQMGRLAESKKSFPVENISWEKMGINRKKVLVVTAHYDTISHDKNTFVVNEKEAMPGANYNASGVAVALGLIKTIAEMDLNYSVRVVFLDWQGIGFHGSELYAKELKLSGLEVMGVINLEMLGQDSTYLDKTKKQGNMCVYVRNHSEELRWVNSLVQHGSNISSKVRFEVKPSGLDSSDNFRFSDAGFLVATFSQNWEDDFNPRFYQTSEDTPETLNHETLYASYQYVAGAVLGTLLDLTK